jgi:Protein of unknwon function (DUF3310)
VKRQKHEKTIRGEKVILPPNSVMGMELLMDDPINPQHYRGLTPEPVEVIESWNLGFHLGNTVKYIARAGRKTPDQVEDLKKARWYLDRKIQKLKEMK